MAPEDRTDRSPRLQPGSSPPPAPPPQPVGPTSGAGAPMRRRPVLTLVNDDHANSAASANASATRHGMDSSRAPSPAGPSRPAGAARKILTKDQLLSARARAASDGLKVVHCHGCFDIVHPGHIRHLRHAKAQGDILLVTITGDALINKGTGRPLIPQELRAENLAAIDFIDWVYIEPRPTAEGLLEEVRPDVYVKGKEYETNSDPRFAAEKEAVLRHGGKVFFSSGDVVFSSTALIAALEQSADPYHARLRELLSRSETGGEELTRVIARFRGQRVVVVGETIRDTYVLCDRPDIAGESPIMTLRPVERRTYDGGAAIIARHLAALGAFPVLVTAMPRDSADAEELRRRLLIEGVEVRAIEVDTPIPEKQRFLVGAQKVMKLDLLERYELDEATQRQLIATARDAAVACGRAAPGESGGDVPRDGSGLCDAVILADFGLGMFSPGLLARLIPELRPRTRLLTGDVSGRRSNLRAMHDMDLVCPSESELRDALGLFDEGLGLVVWRLLAETHNRNVICTMGPEGLIAFDRLDHHPALRDAFTDAGASSQWQTRIKAEHVPALTVHATDPLGCGDAMLATATLALGAGSNLLAAAFLGACAAAVQVQRLGNTVISATDLRQIVARVHSAHLAYTPREVIEARAPMSAPTVSAQRRAVGV